jgi:hypothetical protein
MPKGLYDRRSTPAELDEDMSRTDLIDVLERLRFVERPSITLRIDHGVRDFLVRALRGQR